MAEKGFKRFIPALIPLVMEIINRTRRERNHDKDIEKIDQAQEKLATLENLMVKMEKKFQNNREDVEKKLATIKTFLIINTILLLFIAYLALGQAYINCPF